jgi:signal transduction histidine kinase
MTTDRKRDVEHDFQIDSALKGIMDFSPIGIAVFSHDTSLLYANPLAERLFDKQMPEAVGLRCGDFIGCARRLAEPQGCGPTRHCPACPFDHAICAACSDEPAMAIREGEAFLERKAGLPSMWVKYKVSGLAVKARKVAIMTVDDITRQKEDEQQLRHSLTELSVIHEHAPVVMMLVDRDRRVQRVNGFAAKFADRPSDEMIGLRGGEALRCLHHLDDPQGCGFGPACAQCLVREAVLDAFETGLSQRDVEAWLPFPQGESSIDRCLIISTAYLKIGDSERVIVCSQDITDRKRAEEEREKLQARMAQAQKMESIGTLAGGIAHDFNNILSIIVGNTEMAMLDVPDWSPAQDNLKEVREATLRARDLVKQILMFARQKEHTVSNIRLEPVARESLKMLRASIPTMVEIREDIEEHLPSVLADPSQIQQIIINLCTNAGQVMEAEGGALTVTLDSAVLEAPLHTMVQELPPGRYVRMQVKDTGPGIPAENMERIFDPFFTTKGVKARAWGLPLSTALSRTAMAVLPWRAKRAGELRLRFTCPPRSWNRLN